jgi:flagellar basal-body rod protein FlgF
MAPARLKERGEMENTNYIALSSMTALRRQMDVIANNIANAETTAYRAERMLFEEYLADIGTGMPASFVLDYGVVRDTMEGQISATVNPLDVAISGKGYLVIETDEGLRYTRNGHFKLNDEGTLVTSTGNPVLDNGGKTITVPLGDGNVVISPDGVVSTESGTIGQLDLVSFENEQELRKAGDGLYTTDAVPLPAEEARFLQGMIESSNVEPIIETTEMMRLVRRYQSIQKLMEQADELRRRAVNTLGGGN